MVDLRLVPHASNDRAFFRRLFLDLNVLLQRLPANRQQIPHTGGPTLKFDLCAMLVVNIARQQEAFILAIRKAGITGRRRRHILAPKPRQKRRLVNSAGVAEMNWFSTGKATDRRAIILNFFAE